MTSLMLNAQIRQEKGKKTQALREQGLIPAVLYGKKINNQNLALKRNEFLKILDEAGMSKLIDLKIGDEKTVKILIHDYQNDPAKDDITHVDLYQITEGQKITTSLELEFINEAPAVKELGGILVKNVKEVEVEILPKDLEGLATIQVDLSVLKTFNDAIHVKDLAIPKTAKIMINPEEVVVAVSEPEKEEVYAKPAEATPAAESAAAAPAAGATPAAEAAKTGDKK